MAGVFARGWPVAAAAALVLGTAVGSAGAQDGSGTLTGRVVWCAGGIGYPVVPGLDAAPGAAAGEFPGVVVEAAPDGGRVVPGAPPLEVPRRPSPRPIPAGAVLVAVQGTSLSVRTDENGRFSLPNVPAGQYLALAAGPVGSASGAFAVRPNASVQPGQTVDVGTLLLGVHPWGCRFYPVPLGPTESEATPAAPAP